MRMGGTGRTLANGATRDSRRGVGEVGKVRHEWVHRERASQEYSAIPDDDLAGLPVNSDGAFIATGTSLREFCHDLIEPATTIRWLARAAVTDAEPDLRDRLGTIALVASQIAAICEQVFDLPRRDGGMRLDMLADEVAASAQVRYVGVIDVVVQPATALAPAGDLVRILGNLLANACRAAGPAGRVRVIVDEADGQARLVIGDTGSGLGQAAPGGRAGLGLHIVGALARKHGGSVHLGVSDLGGLAVTVLLPAPGGPSK
jgi:signal transduction histidine kinase